MASLSVTSAKSWVFAFDGLEDIYPAREGDRNILCLQFSSWKAQGQLAIGIFTEKGRPEGVISNLEIKENNKVFTYFYAKGQDNKSYHELLDLFASVLKPGIRKQNLRIHSKKFDRLVPVVPLSFQKRQWDMEIRKKEDQS